MADTKPEPDNADPRDEPTEELVAYLDGELDPKAAESVDPGVEAAVDAVRVLPECSSTTTEQPGHISVWVNPSTDCCQVTQLLGGP